MNSMIFSVIMKMMVKPLKRQSKQLKMLKKERKKR